MSGAKVQPPAKAPPDDNAILVEVRDYETPLGELVSIAGIAAYLVEDLFPTVKCIERSPGSLTHIGSPWSRSTHVTFAAYEAKARICAFRERYYREIHGEIITDGDAS